LLHQLGSRLRRLPYAAPAAVLACAAALSALHWQRNEVWRSDLTLWQDTSAKSPDKFRVWGNLAAAYIARQDYQRAVECSRRALQIEPRFHGGILNLLCGLHHLGRYQEVIQEVRQAVASQPHIVKLTQIQYFAAIALINTNHPDEGMNILHAIVVDHPDYHDAHVALGVIYQQRRQFDRALRHLRSARQVNPDSLDLGKLIADCESRLTASLR
jgi:tetratricopeptide (TPR) repeat protein